MLVTPLVLIQIFSKRMLVDWPKCGSDPRDEGHLACLAISVNQPISIVKSAIWSYRSQALKRHSRQYC